VPAPAFTSNGRPGFRRGRDPPSRAAPPDDAFDVRTVDAALRLLAEVAAAEREQTACGGQGRRGGGVLAVGESGALPPARPP
jgi:hypothetical protein